MSARLLTPLRLNFTNMKTKKTVLLLAVLMVATLCFCGCATQQTSYTGGEVCGFTPYQKQYRAKKPQVHPAPDTPIGGDYMRY